MADFPVSTAGQFLTALNTINSDAILKATANTITLAAGCRLEPWNNNWFKNRTWTAVQTIQSADNSNRGTIEGFSAANTLPGWSATGNVTFYQVNFDFEFVRGSTDTTGGLRFSGASNGPIRFQDCILAGTPWTTIGPGIHFRGCFVNTGSFNHQYEFEISDCIIRDMRRGTNMSGVKSFIMRDNEIYNIAQSWIQVFDKMDDCVFDGNYLHSPYSDQERVGFANNAKVERTTGLTGQADSTKALFFAQLEFGDSVGTEELIFTHGGFTIRRLSTGFIKVQALDTAAAVAVTMTGATSAASRMRIDVLVSLDTTGTSRLYMWKEAASGGGGAWISDASTTASGQTLDLTGAFKVWGINREIYISRLVYWSGISSDITVSATRDLFVDSLGMNMDRDACTTAPGGFGAAIVDMYKDGTDGIQLYTNRGTGGTFTRSGLIEADHSDMFVSQPNVNVTNWEITNNRLICTRHDALKDGRFDSHDIAGIFMEDIGGANHYDNINIHHNLIMSSGDHGITLNNPTNSQIKNNTSVYNPAWVTDFGRVPKIRILQQFGGTASNNVISENISGAQTSFEPSDTVTNNIQCTSNTTGVNDWDNLFVGDGGLFAADDLTSAEACFEALSGGALDAASPAIGAIPATIPIAPENIVAPVVTGSNVEGQTLSCSTGSWVGTATIVYTYQWRNNGINIGGATASTYVTQAGDVGDAVDCVVTATNGVGNAIADSNDITVIAAVTAPVNVSQPAVSGTPSSGNTLSCTTGTWSGGGTITFAYQWRRNGSNIPLATSSTYLLTNADAETSIDCLVTATNSAGSGVQGSNNLLIEALPIPGPDGLNPPVASGEPQVGRTVICTTGAWINDPTDFQYQWFSGGVEITDAQASSYVLTSDDVGLLVYCVVTASNAFGSDDAISNSIGPISDFVSRGGVWPQDDEKRERAFKQAAEARAELRQSIADLIEGRKKEAKASVKAAVESLKSVEATVTELPEFSDIRATLSDLRTQLERAAKRKLIEKQLRQQAEELALIEAQLADDDSAAIAIIAAELGGLF